MVRLLYGFPYSANTHRARLMLSILDLDFEDKSVNLLTNEQRSDGYLAVNPLGQVPALVDDGKTLIDSHAILVYLAKRYNPRDWWHDDPGDLAQVMQWLFVDANEIHNGIGLARNHIAFRAPGDPTGPLKRARVVLDVLEQRLKTHEWLELNRATLADIACAPLVSVADEASIDMTIYPGIQRWLAQISRIPGYSALPRVRKRA
ncbi:glutathione S-transferase family protein [Rhodopseudomonas boonkerdii]|nr:glutathione S-transferase family protein [Rhodopseudomonas boonkerdii]UGV25494.1 glutathione S-transferase family protein [Rhodopseudomonas boonkerdii]